MRSSWKAIVYLVYSNLERGDTGRSLYVKSSIMIALRQFRNKDKDSRFYRMCFDDNNSDINIVITGKRGERVQSKLL